MSTATQTQYRLRTDRRPRLRMLRRVSLPGPHPRHGRLRAPLQGSRSRPREASGPRSRPNCTGSSPGTRCSTGTAPGPSGSRRRDSTSPTTASTVTSPPGATTRPPSSGKASRAKSRTLTYQQLLIEVSKFANVLKSLGVQKGDRVAIYMGMCPELPIAMLACARIGAPHTVIFGGFSAQRAGRSHQRLAGLPA